MSEKPSVSDLASFATRAGGLDLGDDIEELGDNLGVDLLMNSSKAASAPTPSSGSRQISFGGGSSSGGEMPSINIKPMDDIDVIDVDAAPGVSDVRINRSSDSGSAPFVLGGSFGNFDAPAPAPVEDDRQEKQKYLTKLQRLEASGIKGQRMTMSHSLDEIKSEHDKLVDSRNLEASIRFQRNALMTFVSGVEMVNDRVGHKLPVKPRLKGWSESVHTNIEDFDDIFEELYDMYKDRAKMHPLLRLGGTLGVSAVMYHLTNTMAERSGIPGMSDLLNENPELRAHFAQAAASKIGGGLGNFMNAAGASQMGGMDMGQGQGSPMSHGSPMSPPQGPPPAAHNRGQPLFGGAAAAAEPPAARREMKGPSGVDDVLRAFEAERMMQQATAANINQAHASIFTPNGPPPEQSQSARFGVGTTADPMADFSVPDNQSIGSGYTANTERRRGRPRRNQATPVGDTLTLNI